MTYGYALQAAGIIAGMSVACLTALTIASTIFDRHTRADTARDGGGRQGAGSPSGRLADPPRWLEPTPPPSALRSRMVFSQFSPRGVAFISAQSNSSSST